MKIKSACIVLAIAMLIPSVGCSKVGDKDLLVIDSNLDMTSDDYVCGNNNVEELYYKSTTVTLPQYVFLGNHVVFKAGENICIIVPNNDNGVMNQTICGYLVSYEGELISSFELDKSCSYLSLLNSCYADWNGEKIITANDDNNYLICDYNGKLLAGSGSVDHELGLTQDVKGWGDSFVILTQRGAVRYDKDYNETGRIKFGFDVSEAGLVVQRNKVYMISAGLVYELDFEMQKAVYKGDLRSAEGLPSKIHGGFGRSAGNSYFTLSTDLDPSYYWEADLADMSAHKTAKVSNIMQAPPSMNFADTAHYILPVDKLHYLLMYSYDDSNAEVVILSPDLTSDYASREKITCRGVGILSANSDLIRKAQYMFNMSQDRYYLELQEWGHEYDLSVPEQADRFRMDVMSDIQNGNAPDIFFGNQFDYLYWGANGTVLDMRPYLEKEGVFDADSITPGILSTMTGSGGEVFQVFPAYRMTGYWGRQKEMDDKDLSIEGIARGAITTDTDKPLASDLLRGVFMYNLAQLYNSGQLTEDNVRKAVQYAVDNGKDNEDYSRTYDQHDIEEQINSSSLIEEDIHSIRDYYYFAQTLGDDPVYKGYPTLGGTVRPVFPDSLVAVYSGTHNPEAACKFVSFFLDTEFQRELSMTTGGIPVNRKIMDELIGYMKSPDLIPDDIKGKYAPVLCKKYYTDDATGNELARVIPLDRATADCFVRQTDSCNALCTYDWGISAIINEEIGSYYSSGKSVDEVAKSLCARLKIYVAENS